METLIAVILAVLIVAGVFVAAICIALTKKAREGQKASRANSRTFSNRTNNLAIGNSNITSTTPVTANNGHPIGVFHIHLNANCQNNNVRHVNNAQKMVHEEPPPSYFALFPQQLPSSTINDENVQQQV